MCDHRYVEEGNRTHSGQILECTVWYGCAPNIVNLFCSEYDWNGNNRSYIATSRGSGLGKIVEKPQPYMRGAISIEAVLVKGVSDVRRLGQKKDVSESIVR